MATLEVEATGRGASAMAKEVAAAAATLEVEATGRGASAMARAAEGGWAVSAAPWAG
jgi:hypothetical protein